MIKQSPAKADKFLEAINKAAMDKCQDLDKKAQQMIADSVKKAEQKIAKQHKAEVQEEIDELKAQSKLELAKVHAQCKAEIYQRRMAYEEEIFSTAYNQVKKFVASDKYESLLANLCKEVADSCTGKCQVFLTEKDKEKFGTQVSKLFGGAEVLTDNTIELGGLKVEDLDSGLMYDNTLDSKFSEQKDWFLNNASLRISVTD